MALLRQAVISLHIEFIGGITFRSGEACPFGQAIKIRGRE